MPNTKRDRDRDRARARVQRRSLLPKYEMRLYVSYFSLALSLLFLIAGE